MLTRLKRIARRLKAFTLIELLITIVIIAAAASGVFVALDPANRFTNTRDTLRWNDINAIRQAEELYRADKSVFLPSIQTLSSNTNYMIGTAGSACTERQAGSTCDVFISASHCVDLSGLAPNYLATIPVAPTASGGVLWSDAETGYYLRKSASGSFLVVGACDAESTNRISTATGGLNQAPLVSPITTNTSDADIGTPGIQYLEGTTVTYSSSIQDPDGDLLTWDWVYSLNSGPEVVYFSGAGALQDLVFTYGPGEAGNAYQWTLYVTDGQLTSQSAFTNTIVSSDQIVDSGLDGPGDFSGSSPRKGLGAGASFVGDFVPAKVGNGLRIDASGEYGRYRQTDGTTKNIELDKGSVEFWYRPNYSHTNGIRYPLLSTGAWLSPGSLHLVKEDAAGANDFVVYFFDTAGTQNSQNRISSLNYSFTQGTWTHIRATWDFTVSGGAQNIHVYLDGKEATLEPGFSVGSFAMAPESSTEYLYIGSRDGGALHGNGVFDELKVYRVSLSGIDTQQPSQPQNLSLSVMSSSQVALSWTPSYDNRKIQGYRIYRCQGQGCSPQTQVGVSTTSINVIDTVPLPGAFYTYAISAYDKQGNESAKSMQRGITIAEAAVNTSPVVSLIASDVSDVDPDTPGVQFYENTKVTYQASASDAEGDPLTWEWKYTINSGPQLLFSNGQGAVQNAVFTYGLGTIGYSYLWTLQVSDGQAITQQMFAVDIVADTQAPTASITAPANNATVSGATVAISASASDIKGVIGVQFLLDGANIGAEDSTAPYSIDWNSIPASDGSHTLSARARDAAGNTGNAAPVSVTVSNLGAAGLIGHWTFDETAGTTANDSSGNNNTGTLQNISSPPTASSGWNAAGRVNGALNFDGSNDYVSLGNMDVTGGRITIAAWFKADTFSGSGNRIVDKSTGSAESNHYWMLGTNNRSGVGEVLRARIRTDSPSPGSVTTLLAVTGVLNTQWHHGAVTYDGSNIILYLDGSEVDRVPKSGNLETNNTVPTQIGRNTSALALTQWDGLVDDVKIYNRALSAAEITALYNSAPPDVTPPTVSLTAPAQDATVSGTVTVSATASDNLGVVGVQFLLDGANLGAEDTTSPYSISWDATTSSNGSHTLSAHARDAAGNTTISSPVSVTVVIDTSPPSDPSSLVATAVSSSQINLSWTASTDNVGVSQYRVERCQGPGCTTFSQIGTSIGATFSSTGLTASTDYSYRVRAVDAAGNLSGYSNVANATTQAPPVSANADFQTRRTAAGVIYSEGFDNFNPATFPALCFGGWPSATLPECYNPASDGSNHAFIDQAAYTSGDTSTGNHASMRMDTTNVASANTTGDYLIRWPQTFGENSHFYLQYRMRMHGFVTGGPGNWTSPSIGGQGWKTSVFAARTGPLCGPIELTVVNFYYSDQMRLYTRCSGTIYDNFQFPADGLYGLTPNWRIQQGDYNGCANTGTPNIQTDCAVFHGDEWNTYYFDVQIGTFGQPNSYVQVYVDRGDGLGMKKWIDAPNYQLSGSVSDAWGLIDLTNYITGKTSADPSPAIYSTWYDEFILSTQPIAAPSN